MGLDHPNLSEDAVAGATLRQRVRDGGGLPAPQALRLGLDLARALSYLHARGQLAPGLSPDAVRLGSGDRPVLVLDAPEPDADAGWVPFERSSGRARPASDLYQLGAVLLFALTGKEPRAAGLPIELLADALDGVPPELRPTLRRLLDPRWDSRPETPLEAAAELDCLVRGVPTPLLARRRLAAALLGLMLLSLGVGAAAWRAFRGARSAAPVPKAGAPRKAPPALLGPINPGDNGWTVVPVYPDVVGVQGSPQGVWVFSKYEVLHHPEPAAGPARRLLERARDAYASGVADGDAVFLGGWKGQMTAGRLGSPPPALPPALGSDGKVESLAFAGGALYAAWRGRLWSWREGEPSWSDASGSLPRALRSALATRDGAVLAGGRGGIWRRGANGWDVVWSGAGDEVVALAEDRRGRLLAGTRDGLLTLAPDGAGFRRELRGLTVNSFAEGPAGRLWAGTWKAGLFVRDGARWSPLGLGSGLPSDQVTGVAVDESGLLWVGLYGWGLVVGRESAAAAAALEGRPFPVEGR
ncbi:MAG: hypothetical protein HY554_03690 [Elusimicrobia bacterium]|nr:hypothetical protein [Elusimicrobiota bacterium]